MDPWSQCLSVTAGDEAPLSPDNQPVGSHRRAEPSSLTTRKDACNAKLLPSTAGVAHDHNPPTTTNPCRRRPQSSNQQSNTPTPQVGKKKNHRNSINKRKHKQKDMRDPGFEPGKIHCSLCFIVAAEKPAEKTAAPCSNLRPRDAKPSATNYFQVCTR